MHPSNTVTYCSRTTFRAVTAITFCALLSSGCAPGDIATEGGDGSETSGDGGSGDGDAATGDTYGAELPVPGDETVCVNMGQAVSCWAPWEGAWAQVYPECQRDAAVAVGVWSPSFDPIEGTDPGLDAWGPSVLCHAIVGTGIDVCFYAARVLLAMGSGGWEPVVSSVVVDYPEVDPPCAEPDLCDGMEDRAALDDVACTGVDDCSGTWDPCAFESSTFDAVGLEGLPVLDPAGLWPCAGDDLDVDVCVELVPGGQIGCFWVLGDHAVAVAPRCAVEGLESWGHVGSGMMARET